MSCMLDVSRLTLQESICNESASFNLGAIFLAQCMSEARTKHTQRFLS